MAKTEATEDTKQAIEILRPICNLLGITLFADAGLLYIGEDAIGIGCNSTYATVMEAVGYIFLKEFPKFRYGVVLDKDLTEDIKRYWVGKAALNKLKRAGVI